MFYLDSDGNQILIRKNNKMKTRVEQIMIA